MKYRALMLDVDGTLVVNHPKAEPSERIIEAVNAASGEISVSLATGRSILEAGYIIDRLSISGLCVLDHGAHIYDPKGKTFIREVSLNADQVKRAYSVFHALYMPVYLFGDPTHTGYSGETTKDPVIGLYSRGANDEESKRLEDGFMQIPHIMINKTKSWDGRGISFEITHADATKQHGVLEVARILGLKKEEIIGVGDGYNDFPLLMACGLKIAMGNAVPELKAIADFVAPSVEEDGVATVIEKFILN